MSIPGEGLSAPAESNRPRSQMWLQAIPFIFLHVACLAVFLPMIEATATALTLFGVFYALRVFGLTAGFHRYFAHRSYKTSRVFQFVLALLGTSAMQKGPIWWAGHHRHHHRHSDGERDVHSPIMDTLWHSHVGWIFDEDWAETPWHDMRDFSQYPELRFLEKHHWIPGLVVAVLCLLIGGWSGLVWGFFVSTVAVYHVTFFVNSLCHLWGTRRYKTNDFSRNNVLVALLTFGEGWHNNHHYYQSSANQGFRWWEVDLSYMTLKVLSWFGIVWDLRKPPKKKLPAHADSSLPKLRVEIATPAMAAPSEPAVPTLAALQVSSAAPLVTVEVAATSAADSMRAAAHAASEMLRAAAQAAAERIAQAAHSASDSVSTAGPTVLAAAHSAAESIRTAANHASETVIAAAQSASERVSAAAHSAAESMSSAAVPAVVSAAAAAVPVVMAAQSLAQRTSAGS